MITYTVEGGEVSGEEVQGVIEEKMGRECSVSVDQSLNSSDVNVTVSFSGNTTITPDEQTQAAQALTDAFEGRTFTLLESNSVDATMGARFLQKCLVCFAITFVLLLIYIALRFRKIGGLSAGVSAIVALIHDVLIATCVFVVFAACPSAISSSPWVLTILGYSLNATIVIYDRVRENKRKMGPKVSFQEVMNTQPDPELRPYLSSPLWPPSSACWWCWWWRGSTPSPRVCVLLPAHDDRRGGRLLLLPGHRPQHLRPVADPQAQDRLDEAKALKSGK